MNAIPDTTDSNTAEWIPLPEAARILQLNYGTQIQRCRRGAFPSKTVTVGKKSHYLVRISDLKRFHEASVPAVAQTNVKAERQNPPTQSKMDLPEAPGDCKPSIDKTPASLPVPPDAGAHLPKRPPVDYIKNAMRKFSLEDLLKVSIWINGRLMRSLHR